MIKAEPKTILYFIWNYFDIVRDLFDTQSKEGIIRKELLEIILEKNKKDIKSQLIEYKILRNINDDFELRDVYYKLVEFILLEFRPLLPEEIEKFKTSISELFRKIKEGINEDKTILLERIRALSSQIKEFTDSVEKNSIRLLNETRELKSNVNQIDYREKIQKASFWIQYYINPLNAILDVNHSESISNKLLDVSEFANQKRLSIADEAIRNSFEQLYSQLVQSGDDLLRQSKLLTNELLPLIERIKTESLILTGWIEFLRSYNKVSPPNLLKARKDSPYSTRTYLNTKEYFEQFIAQVEAVIEPDDENQERWVFNRTLFRQRLSDSLPVENFFDWCTSQLKTDKDEISNEKVFALTSLLFDEDLEIDTASEDSTMLIITKTSKLTVPKLILKKNGVS
ncbi:MAG TPA: hypothetical protein PKL56_11815 [Cyclobacteriaceae bacterium]|nr:hypothetical protein [Cyclobacteriaceae bacterium]HMV07480.1 hypothetical protein [Cyclobacteriaceae bacterium]HMW99165.1 hypothetical protein [Cyclobacteriaceae bacterium]HMX48202.1 hypothetical protein [Cyclobacteriaceae bacterium]HMY95007.1 hypothetical protein [Cyclobacteriaceae bacterium]